VPIDSPRFARRSVILASAGLVASRFGRPAAAQNYTSVPATNPGKIKLYLKSGDSGKAMATIPAGSTVRVLAGPDPAGWYLVDQGEAASSTPGWTPGDGLVFSQRALVQWDAGLFGGPSDGYAWVGSIRRFVVVTVAGPSTSGFTFVRWGDQAGYTYDTALTTTDAPLTDPNSEFWADANRATLKVNLMIGTDSVAEFDCRMSSDTGDGFYSTAPGSYHIYELVEGLQYTPYANAYIMYWGGFDPNRYNGFHSWTMDANGYVIDGGWGNTAGCIATAPADAKVIYRFLRIGMRTEIHW